MLYRIFKGGQQILFGLPKAAQTLLIRASIQVQTKHKYSNEININIGTIGHVDHGKTTLTAAITKVLSDRGFGQFYSYESIDKAPEEKARGITINASHIGYRTAKRRYSHTDCPGHADYIKNMISGTSQMDCSILVVAATDGQMPQTVQHVMLAKQIGVKNIIVYINKADLVDYEFLELVEIEIRELLSKFGYDADKAPVIYGSALEALNGSSSETSPSKYGVVSIDRLLQVMDEMEIVNSQRNFEAPFLMHVDDGLAIQNRGTVVVGTIKQGVIEKGAAAQLMGFDTVLKTTVSDIQIFKESVKKAVAGDHVGLLLKNVKRQYARRGMTVCAVKSAKLHNRFEANVYFLSQAEGGRSKPVLANYSQRLFCETWNSSFQLTFDHAMIMPGENSVVTVTILDKMVLEKGQKFTIRENKSIVATGVITNLLSSASIIGSFEKIQISKQN